MLAALRHAGVLDPDVAIDVAAGGDVIVDAISRLAAKEPSAQLAAFVGEALTALHEAGAIADPLKAEEPKGNAIVDGIRWLAGEAARHRNVAARLSDEVTFVAAVAHRHGWDGVENSKLLWDFFDNALSAIHSSPAANGGAPAPPSSVRVRTTVGTDSVVRTSAHVDLRALVAASAVFEDSGAALSAVSQIYRLAAEQVERVRGEAGHPPLNEEIDITVTTDPAARETVAEREAQASHDLILQMAHVFDVDGSGPSTQIRDRVWAAVECFGSIRPKVRRFAVLMEQKLCENDDKGGWRGEGVYGLLGRLDDERGELSRAIGEGGSPADVAREAADVANFAMMIADVVGGMPEERR